MSPSSGELSRAMRNRCVEINIPLEVAEVKAEKNVEDEDMEVDQSLDDEQNVVFFSVSFEVFSIILISFSFLNRKL